MKFVKLTQNKVSTVDDSDYEYVNQFKWHYVKTGYARRRFNKKAVHMHRFITDCPEDKFIDHINGDRLDNRRSNLRICTHKENLRNQKTQQRNKTSKYKGVYLHNDKDKWVANIKVNKKSIYLGRFNTELEAAIAYNNAAILYFGIYASLNKGE